MKRDEALQLKDWLLEPCEKAKEKTFDIYVTHVPYVAWVDGKPVTTCMWCGSRPGQEGSS